MMKSSISLIREMQIKITQIHFSPIRLAKLQLLDKFCGEAVRKQALSNIAGGSVIGIIPMEGNLAILTKITNAYSP